MKTKFKSLLAALACCASAMLIAGTATESLPGLSAPSNEKDGAIVTKKADAEPVNLLLGIRPTTHGNRETLPTDDPHYFACLTDGEKNTYSYTNDININQKSFEAIFDLGDVYSIERVVMLGYEWNKPKYDYVEYSIDGESFELIGQFPDKADVDYTLPTPVVAKYLRFRWNASPKFETFVVTELEAYGTKFEGTVHYYPTFTLPETSRMIDLNSTANIEFTYEMGDEAEEDNFGVVATSTNEELVKIDDVVLDKNNKKVTVSISSTDKTGDANVSVAMTNGVLTRTKTEKVTVWYTDFPEILHGVPATSFLEGDTEKAEADLTLFTDGDATTGYSTYNQSFTVTFDVEKNYQVKKIKWAGNAPQKVEYSTDGEDWIACEEFGALEINSELVLKTPFVFRYIRFYAKGDWDYINFNEFEVYAKEFTGTVHTHPRFTLERKYMVKNGAESKISFKYTMDNEEYAENFAFTATSSDEELFTITNIEHRKLEKKINITVSAADRFASGKITVKAENGEYTAEKEAIVEVWDTDYANIVAGKPCKLTSNYQYFSPEDNCMVITDGDVATYTDAQYSVYMSNVLYTTFEFDNVYDLKKIAWIGNLNHLVAIETSFDGEEYMKFDGLDESTLEREDEYLIFGDDLPKGRFLRLTWANWEQFGSFQLNEVEVFGKKHEGEIYWHPIFNLPYKFEAKADAETVVSYSFDMGEEAYTDTFSATATTDSELFAVKDVVVDKENHKVYITINAGEEHGVAPITVTMTNGDYTKTREGRVDIFDTDVQNILLGLGGAETDGDFTTKPETAVGNVVYDLTTFFDITRIAWAGNVTEIAYSDNGSDFISIPKGEGDFIVLDTPVVARFVRFNTTGDVLELQAFGALHAGEVVISANVPVALEGFDVDIIAEGTPVLTYTSADMDGADWVYYSTDFNTTGGLPENGEIKNGDVVLYRLADYGENNALKVTSESKTLKVKEADRVVAKGIRFVVTSACGNSDMKVCVRFTDGTTKEATVNVTDWGGYPANLVINNLGRVNRTTEAVTNYGFSMSYAEIVFDAPATVESIDFSTESSAIPYVFAAMLMGTPGETIIVDKLNEPIVNKESGRYWDSLTVSLFAEKDDDVIYYTLDGSRPTKESNVYEGPITITESCKLTAVTYRGIARSEFAEKWYEVVAVPTVASIEDFNDITDSYRGIAGFDLAVAYQFKNTAFVTDGKSWTHVYTEDYEFKNGDIIPQGNVFEKYTDETGHLHLELVSECTPVAGNPVEPVVSTIADLTTDDYDKYIHLVGVRFDAKNCIAIELGENAVNVLNPFEINLPTVNNECDIIAIVGQTEAGALVIYPTEFRESTGIFDISSDETIESVYNLQGMRLKTDVRNLPAGIYIINGERKLLKK